MCGLQLLLRGSRCRMAHATALLLCAVMNALPDEPLLLRIVRAAALQQQHQLLALPSLRVSTRASAYRSANDAGPRSVESFCNDGSGTPTSERGFGSGNQPRWARRGLHCGSALVSCQRSCPVGTGGGLVAPHPFH